MVFLSLLLGTDMSVLMNSSKITTEIRQALMTEQYHSLKFYVGAVLALASCITVVGLVATYTAWSMISALSDTNSNTMLRSSMGQYVTAMPSRFVVASLYLFLLWLTLLLIEMISGPLILGLLFVILYLFFQVVISLSAFGRLIIHTGAMGKKRILDPEFERQLLPSGLHASLLIKATERSRRRTSVTEQYQPSSTTNSRRSERTPIPAQTNRNVFKSNSDQKPHAENMIRELSSVTLNSASTDSNPAGRQGPLNRLDSEEDRAVERATRHFSRKTMGGSTWSRNLSRDALTGSRGKPRARKDSADSSDSVDELVDQIDFPRASVLNRTNSNQLKNVVNDTLSSRDRDFFRGLASMARDEMEQKESAQDLHISTTFSDPALPFGDVTPTTAVRKLAVRRGHMVSDDNNKLQHEWKEEDNVRSVYDIEPPPELFSDDEFDDEDVVHSMRASLLNRTRNLSSLRQLVVQGVEGIGESLSSLARRHSALNRIQETPSAEDFGFADESSEFFVDDSEIGVSQQHRVQASEADDAHNEQQHLLRRSRKDAYMAT